MDTLFSRLTLADIQKDALRNIVSIRQSQDLFDDLSDEPTVRALAQAVEEETQPPPYRSRSPVIERPFEDAAWFNAIDWPFRYWRSSRFCDGSFGVWYGSDCVATTVHETAYHWFHGLLGDAGFENEAVVIERKVYSVACCAALLDFRPRVQDQPELLHRTDYGYCQSVGARIHREGHPGLVVPSVRHPQGENYVVFNPAVLANPRANCELTYRLAGQRISVEKAPGTTWLDIPVAQL
jgi:hypothetical protein